MGHPVVGKIMVQLFTIKLAFPLNRNGIVKSCDSSRFWLIVARLITIENKNRTEIGSDLQSKNFVKISQRHLSSKLKLNLLGWHNFTIAIRSNENQV